MLRDGTGVLDCGSGLGQPIANALFQLAGLNQYGAEGIKRVCCALGKLLKKSAYKLVQARLKLRIAVDEHEPLIAK